MEDKKLVDLFICPVCGYTVEGEPPDNCPVCKAVKKLFKRID
jgi:rubrerythrin